MVIQPISRILWTCHSEQRRYVHPLVYCATVPSLLLPKESYSVKSKQIVHFKNTHNIRRKRLRTTTSWQQNFFVYLQAPQPYFFLCLCRCDCVAPCLILYCPTLLHYRAQRFITELQTNRPSVQLIKPTV